MKKSILLLFLIAFFVKGYSQCKDCKQGKPANPGLNYTGKRLPPDSNNGLAKSYILQNVCGLNWEQSSVLVETRSKSYGFNANGTGLPSTVPLTFSSCNVDSVVKAFLYFNGSYFTRYAANPASVSITNPSAIVNNYTCDSIGTAGTKCWTETGTIAYRCDVTTSISGGGNYTINLTGTGINAESIDGITLLVIYVDKSASYSGSIVLYDGLYTSMGGSDAQTFTGFNVCSATPTGQAFGILADMQSNACSGINTEMYNGSTNTFPNLFYNFCTVTTPLTAAQTSSTYNVYTNNLGCDCYSWVLAGLYWQNTNCMTCTPTVLSTIPISIVPPRDTICQGDSVQLTASGATTYIWAPSTGLSCTACPNPKASPNATTTYSVTGFDSCTIGTDTMTVVVEPKGTLSVTPATAEVCPGGSVPLLASGGTNYLWKPSSTLSCSTCPNPTATPTTTVTTYTVISGFSGCKDSLSVTITLGAPVPSVTPFNPSICIGSNTTLTATGDSAYIWKPSSSLSCANCPSPLASPTATTTYTVIGIAPGGCMDSTTTTVTVDLVPKPIITGKDSICSGYVDTLFVTGGTTYIWSNGATTTSISGIISTTKTFTVTAYNGGCSHDTTFTVSIISTPTAVITAVPDSVCQGDSILLKGSGGVSYTWSTGSTASSIWVVPSTTTTYTLQVFAGTCYNSTTKTVYITPLVTENISQNDTVCPNTPVTLTATAIGGLATYKWNTGKTTSSITVSDSVTTTYTATVYGKCDSVKKTVKVVIVPFAKPVIKGGSWRCTGKPDTLTVSGGTTYKWSNGSTSTSYIIKAVDGDSTISVVAYNSIGCADTVKFPVTDRAKPAIKPIPPGVSCNGSSVTLTANATGTGPFTYLWSNGATTSSISVTDTGVYHVTVSNGCPNSATTTVSSDSPNFVACCNKTIIMGDDTIILASGDTGITTYSWSPSVDCKNPSIVRLGICFPYSYYHIHYNGNRSLRVLLNQSCYHCCRIILLQFYCSECDYTKRAGAKRSK